MPQPEISPAERQRRQIVRLTFVIYWLLIVEGVLRKYVFPQFGRPLFFIRDPFVILMYVLAFRYRITPRRSTFLTSAVCLAIVCIILVVIQFTMAGSEFSWTLAAYGWRNYFFYLPLAFIVARTFNGEDMKRMMRGTLWVTIPIAVLVYFQYRSPATAPINQGFGTTPDEVYANGGVALGLVRTYGPFTSAPGQAAFTLTSLAMLLSAWTLSKARKVAGTGLLLLASVGTLTCIALSGSRGLVIWSGLMICIAAAGLLSMGRKLTIRMAFMPIAIIVLSVILAPVLFPTAVEAFVIRWTTAGESESQIYGSGGVFARAIYDLTSFGFLLSDTPLQGYQMGIGGNAAAGSESLDLMHASEREAGAIETDWGRNVVELGPVIGLIFIGFRITFVFWLGRESLLASRRLLDPLPLLLFGFVGVLLFNGQVTGHGTLNGYGWLFAGVLMAVNDRAAGGIRERRYPAGVLRRSAAPWRAPAASVAGVSRFSHE